MSHISPTTVELLTVEHVLPEQLTGKPKLRPMQMLALAVVEAAVHDLAKSPNADTRDEARRFLTDPHTDGPLGHWCALLPGVSQQAVVDRVKRLSGRLGAVL